MVVAIDPVCLMEVDTEDAAAASAYRGQTYYFCAPGCKTAFDEDPERYLAALADAVARQAATAPQHDPYAAGGAVRADPTRADAVPGAITMPVDVAIRSRRSVARLRPDPVPHEAIERMLDAAVWAPNHHLTEPWEFVVLTGESVRRFAHVRREFRRTLFPRPDAPEIQRALEKIYADAAATPVIIAVTTTDPADPDLREDDYAATMCAVQNVLLVATGLGLGTYLRTGGLIHYPPLRDFLGVAPGRRVAGLIYVGYPAHIPERRRTPAREKTRWLA